MLLWVQSDRSDPDVLIVSTDAGDPLVEHIPKDDGNGVELRYRDDSNDCRVEYNHVYVFSDETVEHKALPGDSYRWLFPPPSGAIDFDRLAALISGVKHP